MLKACPRCGAISCTQHKRDPNKTRNPNRDLAAQHRFARAVKKRDGYACTNCGSTNRLQAHHTRPGYHPDCGITLCTPCHKAIDPYAR